MKDWFDREELRCISCGQRWILVSNKQITKQQHQIWIKAVVKHHEQMRKEKGE